MLVFGVDTGLYFNPVYFWVGVRLEDVLEVLFDLLQRLFFIVQVRVCTPHVHRVTAGHI
jgi:hypothetical protein